MIRFFAAMGSLLMSTAFGWAHFNMLLPSAGMVQKGEKVTFVYQFGHPFEHELSDAPAPAGLDVILPDRKTRSLLASLEKFKKPGGEGKDVDAYRFTFAPEQRGDHWFTLTTPPIWFADGEEFMQDTVQVLLHVQTQNGWDKAPGKRLRMAPLTRPYGLLPGVNFQAQVLSDMPQGGSIVEIERYNPQKPKVMPMDEFVTFKARTDPNGVFTCTLLEAGWWCMTAQRADGMAKRDGKDYPLRERVTLWVQVDSKAK